MLNILGKEQQRTNRFYASTNGGYLWKWKDDNGSKAYQKYAYCFWSYYSKYV